MRLVLAFLALLPTALNAAPAPTPAKPALWKVSDADTTIWLFGTIHMLGPNIDWFKGPVATAFTGAQALAVETEIPEPAIAQQTVGKVAYDLSGPPLSAKLQPALYERLTKQMTAFGLPEAFYQRADPWYASVLIETVAYQKMGLAREGGVEVRLMDDARKTGKPIIPLEGFEEQLSIFDTLPVPVQTELLESTLEDVDEIPTHISALITSWTKGDEATLEHEINEDMDKLPALRTALIDQRNDRFAAWIIKRLDTPGSVFMAIGAGHLGGNHNVRALLKAKGYTVERVQ